MNKIILLLALLTFNQSAFGEQTGSKQPLLLKRASLDDIIQHFRDDLGLKIAYIQASEDVATLKPINDVIKDLLAIPSQDRTPAEIERLKGLQTFAGQAPGNGAKVVPVLTVHDFTLPASLNQFVDPKQVDAALKQLTQLFPRYTYSRSNSLIVIGPKNDLLQKADLNMTLKKVSIKEALNKMDDLLEKKKIARMVDINENFDSTPPITLDVQDATLIELLCRFSECLGPDVTFNIRGAPPEIDWRAMAFFKVSGVTHE